MNPRPTFPTSIYPTLHENDNPIQACTNLNSPTLKQANRNTAITQFNTVNPLLSGFT